MKYVLIVVLISCCTYIGFGVSRYYKNRKDFFSDLVMLLDKLRLDINFSKEKIGDIISNFSPLSNHFNKLRNNFLSILDTNKFDEEVLIEGINILKDDEISCLISFFKSLGRFDIENQTRQIVSFKEEFQKFESECNQKKQKYGSLFIKLGFIIGVLISLLIV